MANAQKPAGPTKSLISEPYSSVADSQLPTAVAIDDAFLASLLGDLCVSPKINWLVHSYKESCSQQLLDISITPVTFLGLKSIHVLDGAGVDPWDSFHQSVSAWGSAKNYSSQSNSNRTNRTLRQMVAKELNMISSEDQAERIRMWVDYGTYGLARQDLLGDVSPWVLIKYSVGNNCTKRDEGITQLLESIDLLFITEPLMGIRTRACTRGAGSRGGARGGRATTTGQDRKRASSANGGEAKRHKGPNKNQQRPGDEDKTSNKPDPSRRKHVCHVPDNLCKDRWFNTLDELLQHLAGSHMDQCCPVCEGKISFRGGRWVLNGGYNIRVESDISIFFANNANMKHHIIRVHLKPFRCPECPYGSNRNGLAKHLKSQHRTLEHPEAYIQGLTNMNHAELVSVLHKFEGSHPKDEMKTILKDSDIIEKLKSITSSRPQPVIQDQQLGSQGDVPILPFNQADPHQESSLTDQGNVMSTPIHSNPTDMDQFINWGTEFARYDLTRNGDITENLSTAAPNSSSIHTKGTSNFPHPEPANLGPVQPISQADNLISPAVWHGLNSYNVQGPIDSITSPRNRAKFHHSTVAQDCSPATERLTSRPCTDAGGTNAAISRDQACIPLIAVMPPEIGDLMQPTNTPSPLPQTKTIETIFHDSGLTDDEVDELGWTVTKGLAEFVRMWEKYSVSMERMGSRAKRNMARVLDSKELCPLSRAIFNYQSLNGIGLARNFAAGVVALPPGQVVPAPITQETQKSVQPTNNPPSLPEPKSLETIILLSGLTNEEVDELGWAVVGELAGFVRLCEKMSAAVERMSDRAKENMAKILDFRESRALSIAICHYQTSNGVGLTPNFGDIAPPPKNGQLNVPGSIPASDTEDDSGYVQGW